MGWGGTELSKVLWQRDFWDTQLRCVESYSAKWDNVRHNPVRAGLVTKAMALALPRRELDASVARLSNLPPIELRDNFRFGLEVASVGHRLCLDGPAPA